MHAGLITALAEVTGLSTEEVTKSLARPKESSHGDFAFPCFALAKQRQLAPPKIAQELSEKIKLPTDISHTQVMGPYLNFFLDRAATSHRILSEILTQGLNVGKKPTLNKTVVIDYSGPNIAKPFHVGHLRTTLIGLSLDRVFRHLGYTVVGVNHLGDWGTQFGYVYAGHQLAGKPVEFSIQDLLRFYVRATTLKKAQEENTVSSEDKDKPLMTEIATEYFLKLEADDVEARAFWQRCMDVSLIYLKDLYDRLGIVFDHYQGESFYRGMLSDIEAQIKKSGILEDSRGARGVDLGEPLGFARIFAEDGRSLYITRDIACAIYREETYHPEKLLYVVAAQQNLHFQQLIEILRRMRHPCAEKIVHISYGLVPGMKTREGTAIQLDDFLEEAHKRALAVYETQVDTRPEGINCEAVAEQVAIGAIYFYYLSHSNTKEFQFRWEEALTFQGDSGPYIQYALARLNSIIEKATTHGITLDASFNAALLTEDSAHALVSLLGRFGEVLEKVTTDYELYPLATLLLDISRTFASAYKDLRVIGQEQELAQARLALFAATRSVLHTGMHLLGMPPVEKM